MRISEFLAPVHSMSADEYAGLAQQRDAQARKTAAKRRAELAAKQQAAQQAQLSRQAQMQPRKLTFGRKRKKQTRQAKAA